MENFLWVEKISQKCGLFRKKEPDSNAWLSANITYQVFDSPSHPGNFEERQKFLSDLIAKRCNCDTELLGIPMLNVL